MEYIAVLSSYTSCPQEAGDSHLSAFTGQVRKHRGPRSLRASVSSSGKWGDNNDTGVMVTGKVEMIRTALDSLMPSG